MAHTVRDSFLDLEKHRQILEDNIAKLRKSLRHWQTWEVEYEGLKEEILAAKPTPNRNGLVVLARQYEGELVDRRAIDELLGPETREVAQIVNLLDRRLDYVEQNVRTAQKQIEIAENKLANASIISTPEVRNEEGLPLTEIMEELDDDGNVISSSTSTAGSAKPQLLEILEKAGVEIPGASPRSAVSSAVEEKATPTLKSLPIVENESEPESQSSKPAKKGVKFAEDTKAGSEPKKSQTAKRVEEIMSIAKRSEAGSLQPAVRPANESAEDAALRREMLQYGMSEVGKVVAELNLEDGSDWDDEDYEDDDMTDDEDAFGRSTGRVVDDDLRQRMIELEERLGLRMMENVGKKSTDKDLIQEGIGQITISGNADDVAARAEKVESVSSVKSETSTLKKSVRFSEQLDISPDVKSVLALAPTIMERKAAPVSDIVERTVPAQPPPIPKPQKKQTRFKSARVTPNSVINGPLVPSLTKKNGPSLPLMPARPSIPKPFSQPIKFIPVSENTRTVPTGPDGKTMALQVIERTMPENALATEPDGLDPQLLYQEVATDYHKLRNRMIQRQGGFVKEEESEIVPLTEAEGGPKKMSRFKAARLTRT